MQLLKKQAEKKLFDPALTVRFKTYPQVLRDSRPGPGPLSAMFPADDIYPHWMGIKVCTSADQVGKVHDLQGVFRTAQKKCKLPVFAQTGL